ncbi:polyprenyl synthetase family protein [Erythrobacteraceae bacterium CFH 75059]|nr:polyprenyl synthetase family protein [Erythrobacteraceae bacterium CFH 75059]
MAASGGGADTLGSAMASVRQEIDAAFGRLLPVPDDRRARLVEAMRYAAIGGGKRIRPLLLTEAARQFSVDRDIAIRAACAVEAIHIYSLIHDDLPCMDDDATRHGRPTVHVQFDEATAVLAGDCLHALAFELLATPQMSGDPFVRAELVECLARASGHNGMAGGQMMDMLASAGAYDLPTVTRLQQLKTGALLSAAVEMGMILGRLPVDGRAPLRAYARDLGLAFQIADDLLDVEGDEELAGKALRKDGEQGKQTFVTILGVEGARNQARTLAEQAVACLSGFDARADVLRALARFVVERDR